MVWLCNWRLLWWPGVTCLLACSAGDQDGVSDFVGGKRKMDKVVVRVFTDLSQYN